MLIQNNGQYFNHVFKHFSMYSICQTGTKVLQMANINYGIFKEMNFIFFLILAILFRLQYINALLLKTKFCDTTRK